MTIFDPSVRVQSAILHSVAIDTAQFVRVQRTTPLQIALGERSSGSDRPLVMTLGSSRHIKIILITAHGCLTK
jgi:hypothetical protein